MNSRAKSVFGWNADDPSHFTIVALDGSRMRYSVKQRSWEVLTPMQLPGRPAPSELLTTAILNGAHVDVGVLRADGFPSPGAMFQADYSAKPKFFLAHRGPDTKEILARPTKWFLSKVFPPECIFFDDDDPFSIHLIYKEKYFEYLAIRDNTPG